MATFVLVHGAWHGSWCWKRVRTALQRQGHEVFTPTLTGVGERAHLLSPKVDLETHIDDVANLIRWEELDDVVLCGHSYAGLRRQQRGRTGCLIGLRASSTWMPSSPAPVAAFTTACRKSSVRTSWTWRVRWVKAGGCRPFRRKCSTSMPRTGPGLTGNARRSHWRHSSSRWRATWKPFPRRQTTYVLATGWEGSPFTQFFEPAVAAGWRTHRLDGGHDLMLDRPAETTQILLSAAGALNPHFTGRGP